MNQTDINKTIERYNRRLEEFGATEKALGWGDKGRSRLRFEILLSQWCLKDSSILDFGCGFGDLYAYICEKTANQNFEYLGVDINPKLIEVAKQRYPEAQFAVKNILSDNEQQSFDYVFASGTFNAKLENNLEFIASCVRKFSQIARKGFALNFLSDKVEYQTELTYHASPAQMLDLFYTSSKNVVLRNDYMPFEFTVFANLGAQVDKNLTVFEDFVRYV